MTDDTSLDYLPPVHMETATGPWVSMWERDPSSPDIRVAGPWIKCHGPLSSTQSCSDWGWGCFGRNFTRRDAKDDARAKLTAMGDDSDDVTPTHLTDMPDTYKTPERHKKSFKARLHMQSKAKRAREKGRHKDFDGEVRLKAPIASKAKYVGRELRMIQRSNLHWENKSM
jgi:hypothetical protein